MRSIRHNKITILFLVVSMLLLQSMVAFASSDPPSERPPTTIVDFGNSVEKVVKEPNLANITNAVDVLTRLKDPTNKDYYSVRQSNTEKLINAIENLENTDEKAVVVFKFMSTLDAIAEKTMLYMDVINALKVVVLLPKSDLRTDLNDKLIGYRDKILEDMKKGQSYDGGSIPDEWLDELGSDSYLGFDKDMYKDYRPGFEPPKPSKPQPDPPRYKGYEEKYEYVYENGQYYKITTRYENGKKIGTPTKTLATELEKALYYSTSGDTHPNAGSNDSPNWSSEDGQNDNHPSNGGKDQSTERQSSITIQYTLDKNRLSPIYFDTSIIVSSDNTITYHKAKEVMQQLVVKSGGSFVDDVDKFLTVLEGKIIVIKNTDNKVDVYKLERLFDDLNVEVKSMYSTLGEMSFMQDYLQIRGLDEVIVDGTPVKLEGRLLVENLLVIFPIEQIAKSIGANVITDENTITIQHEDTEIVYGIDKQTVLVNGEEVQLDVPTSRKSNGVVYGQIQVLMEKTNSTIAWDILESQIIIKTKPW